MILTCIIIIASLLVASLVFDFIHYLMEDFYLCDSPYSLICGFLHILCLFIALGVALFMLGYLSK